MNNRRQNCHYLRNHKAKVKEYYTYNKKRSQVQA